MECNPGGGKKEDMTVGGRAAYLNSLGGRHEVVVVVAAQSKKISQLNTINYFKWIINLIYHALCM